MSLALHFTSHCRSLRTWLVSVPQRRMMGTATVEGSAGLISKKPLILLEVDGVIHDRDDYKISWKDKTWVRRPNCWIESRIVYSPTVIDAINRWSEVADIRWLTYWDIRAQTDLSPAVGLKHFELARPKGSDRRVDADNDDFKRRIPKEVTARACGRESDPDRLIIWIDGDLSEWYYHDNKRNVEKEDPDAIEAEKDIYNRPNTVLLSPYEGLSFYQVAFVDEILSNPSLSKDKCVLYPNQSNTRALWT